MVDAVAEVQGAKAPGSVNAAASATKASEITSSTVRAPNVSGRFWKEPKQRASSIRKHKRDSVSKKLKERVEKKRSKELTQRIKDTIAEEGRLKRERQDQAKKRKEENSRKSEVVQKIKDTRKIKRMKKKQLRQIEKRDTTAMEN